VRLTWLSANLTEETFLHELLELDDAEDSGLDIEVVVYSGIQREPSAELVALAKSPRESRRVLIHLSDEKLRHRNDIYSRFDLVLRNYFDPRLLWKNNVVFLPLGWTESFRSRLSDLALSPDLTWSFCGASKADRELMVQAFDPVFGGFHHLSTGWNSSDQIPPSEVRDIYENSLFVLCPQGNAHVDTFRVMEALQAGAIPVTVDFLGRDFFCYTFGDHPFVVERDWSAAAQHVLELVSDPVRAAEYRQEVRDWYLNYLVALRLSVKSLIVGTLSPQQVLRANPFLARARFDFALMVRISRRFRRYRR
jgi:hypothetical protein